MDRRARGAGVEDAALAFLLANGMRLVARNAGFKVGELDLVMRDGASVVFVEVRYRSHAGYGGGAASVDFAKQRYAWNLREDKQQLLVLRIDVDGKTSSEFFEEDRAR